jgi:hypothetical protein
MALERYYLLLLKEFISSRRRRVQTPTLMNLTNNPRLQNLRHDRPVAVAFLNSSELILKKLYEVFNCQTSMLDDR